MQRLNAASCLLFALLPGAVLCPAARRMKVQVVETHTGVNLGDGPLELAGSPSVWSRCSGISGTYSKELGFYCADARIALPAPAESRRAGTFFYDVSVIMPGEAHVVFHCSTVIDPNCEGFPEYPQDTSVVCSDFVHRGTAYKDCTATGSPTEGIGVYRAALHGDRMTIFGSHWRRSYLQHGTWQFDALAAQDPKPAPDQPAVPPPAAQHPAATPPAPPQESKPASSPDSQPPVAPDTSPAAATDTKPAAGTTGDTKSPGAPGKRLSPADAAEQAIDPQLIEQAKAGDPVAQYKLGYDYFLGRGVPLDYVQAAIWWRKAADQGFPDAQNNLGVLYNSGKGVPQSYAEAYFWENLAAARASGPLQAQFAKNRDESGSKLWLLGRLRVQQRASKWAAEHPVPARTHEPPPEATRGEYP